MPLLKWFRLWGCVKDSPKCFLPIVPWLGHLVLLFDTVLVLAGLPYRPPSSHSSPRPAGVWVWGWREVLHNPTQQERDGLWQQGPPRSNPAAVKEISWYVPTLPLTKSQVLLAQWQDQLTDLCTCREHRQESLQQEEGKNQKTLRTHLTTKQGSLPWTRRETPPALPHLQNGHTHHCSHC